MTALHLFERLSTGTGYIADISQVAWPTWQRTTRALGGYWTGNFTITSQQKTLLHLWDFYHNSIGRRIVENSFGITTWEGEIYEMTITVNGVSYMTTLDPERWHNKVKVQYTYPRVEDVQQGNLAYVSPAGNDGFQDDAQDFSDWETAAPGTAVYEITVTNDDDSTCRGYLGDAFATGGANDSCYIYTDLGLTTRGWNGTTAGKTPSTYVVSHVTRAGVAEETAWAETTDSSDLYGESGYIDVRGEMPPAAAQALRDRRLSEHDYPKSTPVGGVTSDTSQTQGQATLDVLCAGCVYSMNRRYMETDVEPDDVSDQITLLVDGTADAAEFVTAGVIDSNTTIQPVISGGSISMRLWDQCEELTEMGDSSGNRWIAGVYDGRVLDYSAAETVSYYFWRNGKLCNHFGQPVFPTLIRPDIIVTVDDVPYGVEAGSSSAWHNRRQFYVEEVEFIAPRRYRLTPYEGETMEGSY